MLKKKSLKIWLKGDWTMISVTDTSYNTSVCAACGGMLWVNDLGVQSVIRENFDIAYFCSTECFTQFINDEGSVE